VWSVRPSAAPSCVHHQSVIWRVRHLSDSGCCLFGLGRIPLAHILADSDTTTPPPLPALADSDYCRIWGAQCVAAAAVLPLPTHTLLPFDVVVRRGLPLYPLCRSLVTIESADDGAPHCDAANTPLTLSSLPSSTPNSLLHALPQTHTLHHLLPLPLPTLLTFTKSSSPAVE